MTTVNYREKILELINNLQEIVDSKSEDNFLDLLHRMLYYAELYFIEKSLEYQLDSQKKAQVKEERTDVVKKLDSFGQRFSMGEKNVFGDVKEFLHQWREKLEKEAQAT